jgi:hypothetical protein
MSLAGSLSINCAFVVALKTSGADTTRYFNFDLMVMLVLFGGYFLYFGFATWHKFQLQVPAWAGLSGRGG